VLALALTEAYRLTHQEGKVSLRLMIVRTWQECGSLRETARKLHLSQHRPQMGETLPGGGQGGSFGPRPLSPPKPTPDSTGGRGGVGPEPGERLQKTHRLRPRDSRGDRQAHHETPSAIWVKGGERGGSARRSIRHIGPRKRGRRSD